MMPADVRKAVIALIISCCSTLLAVYFDGLRFEGIGYDDPFTLGINLLWVLIIVWVIRDIYKGIDVRLTLLLVGAVLLASLLFSYSAFGFGMAERFYAIELLMFAIAWFLLGTKEGRAWFLAKE